MVFVVKDIIVIFRKNEIILILISFKPYFSHPEKSIPVHKSSLTLRRHCNSGHWATWVWIYSTEPQGNTCICLDTLTSIRMVLPTQTSNIVKYSNIGATQI